MAERLFAVCLHPSGAYSSSRAPNWRIFLGQATGPLFDNRIVGRSRNKAANTTALDAATKRQACSDNMRAGYAS